MSFLLGTRAMPWVSVAGDNRHLYLLVWADIGLKMGWKMTRLRILVCSSPSGHSGAKRYRPLSYLAALNHAISVLAAISVL